ncbi:MAG: ABC transporter ATP-binding protein [Rhodocyclaceae bacterium]
MLAARDIHFSYRGRSVLAGANLDLEPGNLVCLLGANGAGKSTLLKVLLGLLRPLRGEVTLNGHAQGQLTRRQRARLIAYVPQTHAAPFPYTVREIVLMGRLPANGLWKSPGRADLSSVDEVLARLDIAHLGQRPYTELSGGERQLALIARALAQQARLLVMDEPFAGLDFGHQLRLLSRLEALVAEGYGVLMTTHDPAQALQSGQKVALLIDGRVAACGAADAVLTPEAIHRLYGVRVDLLRAGDGRSLAFRPRTEAPAWTR